MPCIETLPPTKRGHDTNRTNKTLGACKLGVITDGLLWSRCAGARLYILHPVDNVSRRTFSSNRATCQDINHHPLPLLIRTMLTNNKHSCFRPWIIEMCRAGEGNVDHGSSVPTLGRGAAYLSNFHHPTRAKQLAYMIGLMQSRSARLLIMQLNPAYTTRASVRVVFCGNVEPTTYVHEHPSMQANEPNVFP